MRLVVIGNSGSGKSTLAARIGAASGLAVHDLDPLHWLSEGVKREAAEARALTRALAAGEAWVIEGVYGWLAEVALARATALLWLDLAEQDCRDGLERRARRASETDADRAALAAWARDYWTRDTSSSFAGHERLYLAFAGAKARLTTRAAAAGFELLKLGNAGDNPAGPLDSSPPAS